MAGVHEGGAVEVRGGMPQESSRPLWYRLARMLEPVRPVFAWLVEREAFVRTALLAIFTLLALAPIVTSVIRRRRPSGSHE